MLVLERVALEAELWQLWLAGNQVGFDAVRGVYCDLLEDVGDPAVALLRRRMELGRGGVEVVRYTWPDMPMPADLYSTGLSRFCWLERSWLTMERVRLQLHLVAHRDVWVGCRAWLEAPGPFDLLELLQARGLL